MTHRPFRTVAACSFASVLTLSSLACSPKSDTSTLEPGVSDGGIKLGVLIDVSGAFAAGGKATLQGLQLAWDETNKRGGVCGKKVELVVEDHGYNTQNAVNQYNEMEPTVLSFQMLLGSPMVSALRPAIEKDKVLTIPSSFASELLKSPHIVLTGTTYQQEMSNAVNWLAEKGEVRRGDTIGHIYLQGEYGEDALAGTRSAAKDLGLKVEAQQVDPSSKDLTSQVSALRGRGVQHIMLTTAPTQTASAVAVAAGSGYDAKFVGSTFTFVPSLLSGNARKPLTDDFRLTTALAPLSSDLPGPARIGAAFKKRWPEQQPNPPVVHGAGAAAVMRQVLADACKKGPLTRENVFNTFKSSSKVSTDGLLPPLDYTQPGVPPTKESSMLRPDTNVLGNLEPVR
jgi:ABC-type branched-subunit amino acid transport system substrate-binding protein